jgi:phosphoglycolate phosphatase-like HAD superfamily hydrolase
MEVQALEPHLLHDLSPPGPLAEVRPADRVPSSLTREEQRVLLRLDPRLQVGKRSRRTAVGMISVRTPARDLGGPTTSPQPGISTIARDTRTGRPLAIVSNNGTPAISAYLDLYDLRTSINFVSARTSSNAALLKPSPHLLHQAVSALDVTAGESVFLGDSTTDIQAAHAAGVQSIGYANKPGKGIKLSAAGADAIAEFLSDLLSVAR